MFSAVVDIYEDKLELLFVNLYDKNVKSFVNAAESLGIGMDKVACVFDMAEEDGSFNDKLFADIFKVFSNKGSNA